MGKLLLFAALVLGLIGFIIYQGTQEKVAGYEVMQAQIDAANNQEYYDNQAEQARYDAEKAAADAVAAQADAVSSQADAMAAQARAQEAQAWVGLYGQILIALVATVAIGVVVGVLLLHLLYRPKQQQQYIYPYYPVPLPQGRNRHQLPPGSQQWYYLPQPVDGEAVYIEEEEEE